MRNITPLLLLFATGCGPDLIGDWEGTCEFNTFEVDLELQIEEFSSGEFRGDADAILRPNGGEATAYGGEFDGTKDGDEMDFDITLVDASGTQVGIQINGTIDDDEIIGECQSGADEGDVELDFEG